MTANGMATKVIARIASCACAAAAMATFAADPLDPDVAFRPSVRLAVGSPASDGRPGFTLDYRIAPGYYLYRERIRVSIDPGTLVLDAPRFPAGLAKEDAFVGQAVIYKGGVTFDVPIVSKAVAGEYTLRIVAQGCLEDRLCYAPFTQEVRVNIPPGFQVSDSVPVRPLPVPGKP